MTARGIDETLSFATLVDGESFREVCKSYSDLFGAGIKIFTTDGDKLVDIRANNSDHCGLIFSVQPTRTMCTNLVSKIKSMPVSAETTPLTVDCFSGLQYKVMPVVFNGDLLGRVIFGPYAPSAYQGPPKDLEQQAPDLDVAKLGKFGAAMPKLAEGTPERILSHLRQVLDVLIHASYKAALTSRVHIASISGAFTDLERSNADLKAANERLQDLDRLKSNFVATVSHELRTPLTSVIGYSEMLLEGLAGALTGEQQGYIRTILEKGESLLDLITQILDMSRVESGNVVLNRAPTEIRRVVLLSLTDVEPQSRKREIHFETEVDEAVTPIVVDADKIRRIITNLVGNAIKFTRVGGTIAVKVDVVLEAPPGKDTLDPFEPERNRYMRIRVTDTGIGIEQDKLQRVFESFYQVDNSATREFGGTGLGLAIVRNFTLAHKGRVDVTSEVGKGSTFTVRLPYIADMGTAARVDGLGMPR